MIYSKIALLLHLKKSKGSLPPFSDKDVQNTLHTLINEGLIKEDAIQVSIPRYFVTQRGEKYIDMLISTPLPVQRWIDPRREDE